jgi:hypothetical protein
MTIFIVSFAIIFICIFGYVTYKYTNESISFDFGEDIVKVIDKLKVSIRAPSRSEVIKRAVVLLKIASDTESDGGKFLLKYKNGKERRIIIN